MESISDSTLGIEGTLGSDADPLQRVEDDESVSSSHSHEAPLGGEPDGVDAGRGRDLEERGRTPHTTLHLARGPLQGRVAFPSEPLLKTWPNIIKSGRFVVHQVWSLTQFYSVDFSQSRIGVGKCVFTERTVKVCVSCC